MTIIRYYIMIPNHEYHFRSALCTSTIWFSGYCQIWRGFSQIAF